MMTPVTHDLRETLSNAIQVLEDGRGCTWIAPMKDCIDSALSLLKGIPVDALRPPAAPLDALADRIGKCDACRSVELNGDLCPDHFAEARKAAAHPGTAAGVDLEDLAPNLVELARGELHDEDCPEDDTCRCANIRTLNAECKALQAALRASQAPAQGEGSGGEEAGPSAKTLRGPSALELLHHFLGRIREASAGHPYLAELLDGADAAVRDLARSAPEPKAKGPSLTSPSLPAPGFTTLPGLRDAFRVRQDGRIEGASGWTRIATDEEEAMYAALCTKGATARAWYVQVVAGSMPPRFSVTDANGEDYPKNQGVIWETIPVPMPADPNHIYWLVWAARQMVVACSGRDADLKSACDAAAGLGSLLGKYFAHIPDPVGVKPIGEVAPAQKEGGAHGA